MVSVKLLKTKVEIVQTSYSFIDGCFILWNIRVMDDSCHGQFIPFVNYSCHTDCRVLVQFSVSDDDK